MHATTCPRCGSHHAYVRVSRGPGLSGYFSVPLGLLCLVGMIAGGVGWLAKGPLSLPMAVVTTLLDIGVASVLLFGLLMFAEFEARRTRRVEGFCGSCGDRWTTSLKRGGRT